MVPTVLCHQDSLPGAVKVSARASVAARVAARRAPERENWMLGFDGSKAPELPMADLICSGVKAMYSAVPSGYVATIPSWPISCRRDWTAPLRYPLSEFRMRPMTLLASFP